MVIVALVNLSNAEATFGFFFKPSKPCHIGIRWIALDEYSQMSTHMPGFQSFFRFLYHFVSAKLATSSVRVKGSVRRLCTQYRARHRGLPLAVRIILGRCNHRAGKKRFTDRRAQYRALGLILTGA